MTMQRRKLLTGLALTAFGIPALAACSSDSGTGSSAGASNAIPADPKSLTANISYAIWNIDQQPATEAIIKKFNAIYPNVKVTIQVTAFGPYWTKLQTQASSDSMPDVFWMNGPYFQLYAANGKLASLKPLVDAKKIDPTMYPKALNDLYSYKGEPFAAPRDYDSVAIMYNKKLLKDAGVPEPTSEWTWQDYHDKVKAVKDKLGATGIYGSADGYGSQFGYYNLIYSNGGSVITDNKCMLDQPKAIEALDWWNNMAKEGLFRTVAQDTETPGYNLFMDGKAAFAFVGSPVVKMALNSKYKDDFQIVELPLAPTGQRKSIIHGVSNAIAANTKNLGAAQAFVAFLASKEAETELGSTGTTIPAYQGTQTAWVNSAPNYKLQIFLDAAEKYSVPLPATTSGGAWMDIESKALAQAFMGAVSMKDAAVAATKAVDAQIKSGS